MLTDNRLDFISNIEPEFIEVMKEVRSEFIKLDDSVRELSDNGYAEREGAKRCLSIARTHIETALQYTIKALCLMGEINHDA